MTDEQYSDLRHYIGVIDGVAIALDGTLRSDLLGVVVAMSNLLEQIRGGDG